MAESTLVAVQRAFFKKGKDYSSLNYGNGHIHDTYLLSSDHEPEKYILQKINTQVFRDPNLLIHNHNKLYTWYKAQPKHPFVIPKIFPTLTGNKYLHFDPAGNPWRLMEFIPDSYSLDEMEDKHFAEEAGRAFGWFLGLTDGLDSSEFPLSIPDFHNVHFRNHQFEQAINEDLAKRKHACSELISFFIHRKEVFEELISLSKTGALPIRLCHNDTKINNVLFRKNKAIAVIDLDTIGPGLVLYDYGDSLRTIANTSKEDEQDLSKTGLNKHAFKAYSAGYLEYVKQLLKPEELNYLYRGPQLMTYIMGIRFLTDYLNGDQYYKTKYAEHNLVRTRVQQKLIESMEANETFMKNTIQSIIE